MNEHHEHEPKPGSREQASRTTPRIYVASLSDYNDGRLHGCWLDATSGVDELQVGIDHMLATSREPHVEEWAVHDYEGFGMVHLDEFESIDTVARLAHGIEQHGPAFAAWADHVGHTSVDALGRFEDAFLGMWDSCKEYAEGLIDDFGLSRELDEAIPELLRGYVTVDVEGFGRDMEIDGMITVIQNPDGPGVWIFDGTE